MLIIWYDNDNWQKTWLQGKCEAFWIHNKTTDLFRSFALTKPYWHSTPVSEKNCLKIHQIYWALICCWFADIYSDIYFIISFKTQAIHSRLILYIYRGALLKSQSQCLSYKCWVVYKVKMYHLNFFFFFCGGGGIVNAISNGEERLTIGVSVDFNNFQLPK